MKVGLHKLRDERASHCWSYGSTNYASSQQSRKISVGVMVDSLNKKTSVKSSKEVDERKGVIEDDTTSNKKPKDVEEMKSPWISPKSLHEQGTTSDLPTKHASVGALDDARLNKFSGVTYERKKKKERPQDFTFAAPIENGSTATLRLRLQEILGAASKSPTPELGADILPPDVDSAVVKPRQSFGSREQKVNDSLVNPRQSSDNRKQKLDPLFKPQPNSDTIETDSECPHRTVERPVTRSLARRTKMQKSTTIKSGRSMKHQGKNISRTLEDGFLRRPSAIVAGTSSILTKTKTEKKISKVEPIRLFNEKDVSEKIQHWSVSPLPAPETSMLGTRLAHSHMSEKERGYEPKNIPTDSRDLDSPANVNQQEDIAKQKETIGSPSVRNFLEQQTGLQSPTFGVNTPASTLGVNSPASTSSLNPTPKTDQVEEVHGFKTPQRKKLNLIESPDDTDKPTDSQKPSSNMKDAEASLSEASSDDGHSGSSEEESRASDDLERFTESDKLFRETRTAKKLKSMVHPAGRSRNTELNAHQYHTKTSSRFTKGNPENNWIPKSSDQNEVDGLTRALELFALELEKLRGKIKSATNKKSSEILISAAEDVRLQLHNAETHIQTDLGKLKSLSKLKRKRVETRFEEQQERLQLIYDKFKEQINQHLQDCKTTFEGLEADQKEFKGTMEKRITSHRKLLMQVEGSIEIRLNDAQKKITATHEVGREKMMQLKQVLGLCLKEGILG